MGTFVYCGLGVLLAKAESARDRAVAREAEELAERARAAADVDTGTLSGGIQAQIAGGTATITTTAETNPGQAYYQHEGSIHNAATEYMARAAEESIASLPRKLADEARGAF